MACVHDCQITSQYCIMNCSGNVTCISQCNRTEAQCISGKTRGFDANAQILNELDYAAYVIHSECPCPSNNSVLLLSTYKSSNKPIVIRPTGR